MIHVALSSLVTSRMTRVYQSYLHLLKRYPWRTQAVTTGALMAGGDVLAQLTISKRGCLKDYDFVRTARFFGTGLLVFGPTMHVWYSALDKFILGPCLRRVAFRKLLWDQVFFLPVYLVGFLVLMAALQGESQHEIWRLLKRDYQPTLLACYSVWPAVQAVSFTLVPGQFRVLLINVVNFFWSAYLSHATAIDS